MKRTFIVALAVLFSDQASKIAVRSFIRIGTSIPIIRRVLYLTYRRNSGAAFGILAGRRLFFIIASLAVIAVIIFYSRELESKYLQFSFGLMLGGAVGNLVDRILFGWVTDFIECKFFPPVFNIADSALVIGVGLFALDIIFEGKRAGKDG